MFEAKEINGKFVVVAPDGTIEDRGGAGYKSIEFARGVADAANKFTSGEISVSDGRDI